MISDQPQSDNNVIDDPQVGRNDHEKVYFESQERSVIYNITKHPLGGYITNFDDENLKRIDSFTQKVQNYFVNFRAYKC